MTANGASHQQRGHSVAGLPAATSHPLTYDRFSSAGPAPWVIISGLHSSPNPSPGMGVARSLREAYGDRIRLLGVDYSPDSTGAYSGLFDEVEFLAPWQHTSYASFGNSAKQLLERTGGYWLSCMDLEVRLLRSVVGDRDHGGGRLLGPPADAFAAASKPTFTAVEAQSEIHIPAWVAADDKECFDFGRRTGWDLWVKGRFHEAIRARGWNELRYAATEIENAWGDGSAFVQKHVPGRECSLTIAALDGVLLSSCWMEKVLVTYEGKTWTGVCTEAPDLWVLAHLRAWPGGAPVAHAARGAGGPPVAARRAGGLWMAVRPHISLPMDATARRGGGAGYGRGDARGGWVKRTGQPANQNRRVQACST